MPDSSIGVYTRPSSPTPVTGQGADAPQVNVPIDDMAAALNRRSFRDGRAPMLGNQDFNGYRVTGAGDAVDAQDYVTKGQMEAAIAAVSVIAPGIMFPYTISSGTAPTGYLFANGQTVSRATYATLWAAVSGGNNLSASQGSKTAGQYGPGDGSTTFSLPNLYADSGYFIRPVSSGRSIGSVQTDSVGPHLHPASFDGDAVPPHQHTYTGVTGGGNALGGGVQGASTSLSTGNAGGFTPTGTVTVSNNTGTTETRPKNIAYPVLIKT